MATDDATERAFERLQEFALILHPSEVDEPILAPSVARAVYEWLVEIQSRAELEAAKVEPRRLALLFGPPGTGKTTLAHHLAARLGLPLVSVQSERLVSKYLGSTGKNLDAFFTALWPVEGLCVLLLDEFDGLARTRGGDTSSAGREMDFSVAVLLQKIEGFRGIGLAATNTKDSIDPAMWRRFGLNICVDLPASEQRFAIIRKYASPWDLEDAAIDVLVNATRGCSPSLLRQLMEGMKRTLILAPKLQIDISRPDRLFAHVAASISPPPEMAQPLLWKDWDAAAESLKSMAWPPVRRSS